MCSATLSPQTESHSPERAELDTTFSSSVASGLSQSSMSLDPVTLQVSSRYLPLSILMEQRCPPHAYTDRSGVPRSHVLEVLGDLHTSAIVPLTPASMRTISMDATLCWISSHEHEIRPSVQVTPFVFFFFCFTWLMP